MFAADSGFFHVRALESRPWMRRTVTAPLSLTPPIEKWYVVSQPAGPCEGCAPCAASAAERPKATAAARAARNVFIVTLPCYGPSPGHTIPSPDRSGDAAKV